MAIIKDYNTATQSDVNAVNFPALQYAWLPEDVVEESDTWTDRIQGEVATALTTVLQNSAGAVIKSAGGSVTATGSTYLKPGTADVVMIAVGFHNLTASLALGNSTISQGIGVTTTGTADYTTADAAGYSTNVRAKASDVGVTGSPGAFGLTVDWGAGTGESKSFNCTETGVFTLNAAGAITGGNINDGCSALGTEIITLPMNQTVESYGIYIFYFTSGLPTDVEQAVQWMVANPLKGVYPAWIGKN